MPTYSYHCDGCGADFEKEQRITEAPVRKCQACGKLKARRMISGGNFILKGGGWYSDAYGLKPGAARNADGESNSSSGSTGTSSSTSASKSVKPSGDGATKSPSVSPAGPKASTPDT